MIKQATSFYVGVWAPIAACWTAVVFIVAAFRDVDVGIGLAFAVGAPLAGIGVAVYRTRFDKKSSIYQFSRSSEASCPEWLRRGLKKGLVFGPISVLGVGLLAAAPMIADRVLTALGK